MIVSIPKPLREKLGDEGSESFIEMMNQLEENQTNAVLALSEQRFEKALTRELTDFKLENNNSIVTLRKEIHDEVQGLRNELLEKIQELREEIFGEIRKLREEVFGEIRKLWEEIYKLREDMQKMRADIIKWMFIFLVGQTGVLAGLILVLLR